MDLNQQLTPNFKLGEFFVTRHASGRARLVEDFLKLSPGQRAYCLDNLQKLAESLERVRAQLGNKAITITSGWRSVRLNRAVGGVKGSRHLIGQAADIEVLGLSAEQVQQSLDASWPGGLGYGEGFTHLDTRATRARFNY